PAPPRPTGRAPGRGGHGRGRGPGPLGPAGPGPAPAGRVRPLRRGDRPDRPRGPWPPTRPRPPPPSAPVRPRRPGLGRRLRHRLLLPGLPPVPAAVLAQDRPLVRGAPRSGARR